MEFEDQMDELWLFGRLQAMDQLFERMKKRHEASRAVVMLQLVELTGRRPSEIDMELSLESEIAKKGEG